MFAKRVMFDKGIERCVIGYCGGRQKDVSVKWTNNGKTEARGNTVDGDGSWLVVKEHGQGSTGRGQKMKDITGSVWFARYGAEAAAKGCRQANYM